MPDKSKTKAGGAVPPPKELLEVMQAKWDAQARMAGRAPGGEKRAAAPRPAEGVRLVGAGDSWFQYGIFNDVLDCLTHAFGYDIRKEAAPGATVNTLVYEWLLNALPLIESHRPKAFLFSGGGNDLAGPEFILMLNHERSGLPALNEGVATAVMASLKHAYQTMIAAVNFHCDSRNIAPVPIVIHGYANPVPDGRGVLWFGPWLGPSFETMGWEDMEVRKSVMRMVIGMFNDMLAELAQTYNNVHHLDLRKVLAQDATDWHNELHPTRKGFETVAEAFHELIVTL